MADILRLGPIREDAMRRTDYISGCHMTSDLKKNDMLIRGHAHQEDPKLTTACMMWGQRMKQISYGG